MPPWQDSIRKTARYLLHATLQVVVTPVLFLLAAASRLTTRPIDVGLGPDPLINNVYHARALRRRGFTAETFVRAVYFTTDQFDYRADEQLHRLLRPFAPYLLFVRALFRYRALYLYFNGGPLHTAPWIWRLEPCLLTLAGIKTVVMPYGSDVHDMRRCKNLAFADAVRIDYPGHHARASTIRARVDLWTRHASHVVSGCDWVDYMDRWDTLMLGHFSIDTEQWAPPVSRPRRDGPLRILHAPNHRAIKGTRYFVEAVESLRAEGEAVELILLEGVSNREVQATMKTVDLVADQLIVGWYAMFAIEAMAMGLPVLCHLRAEYLKQYVEAELVAPGAIPIVNCDPSTVTGALRGLLHDPAERHRAGRRGRAFVLAHHSLDAVGATFEQVQRAIGVAQRVDS